MLPPHFLQVLLPQLLLLLKVAGQEAHILQRRDLWQIILLLLLMPSELAAHAAHDEGVTCPHGRLSRRFSLPRCVPFGESTSVGLSPGLVLEAVAVHLWLQLDLWAQLRLRIFLCLCL